MKDFTKGNIFQQLVEFSIPMLLANLLQAAYSIVDAIWVGRLIGYEAFAAVSVTMPLVFFLVSAVIGMTMSTNILIGQAYGSRNFAYMKKVLSNSFISTMLIALVISVLSIVFTGPLLHLLNTPEKLKPYAHTFFLIAVSGLVFSFGYNWFGAVMRGLGDSKTPLILLVYSTALNILFVPILILGFGPIPPLGVAGAALGTVISSFLILVWAYVFVLRKHPVLNAHNWDFTPDWTIIRKIFSIGIPISFQMSIVSLSGLFIVSLVNTFGPAVAAAYGIGMRLDQLAILPAMAIGMSVSSMVAQNLGAKEHGRVKELVRLSLLTALGLSTLFFGIIYGFPRLIASVFTRELPVVDLTVDYIRIVAFTYFTFSVMNVLQSIVRGAGDTFYMMVFSLVGLIIVRYPLALWLSKTALQERGIWLGILLSTVVGLTMNYLYYRSGRWKRLTILPKMPPQTALEREIEENIV